MIKINGDKVETFKFSGGEVHPKIERIYADRIVLKTNLRTSDDIMELLLVKNAIDQLAFYRQKPITLLIPYVPYARQDRICNPGEALGIKVMADLINSMNFDQVIIVDPHSDVAPALINNCLIWDTTVILDRFSEYKEGWNLFDKLSSKELTLVSPDAGAEKKVLKVAQRYDGLDIIRANKIRDTKTGKIVATDVNYGYSLKGKDVLIVDDICDGGMTFIKLAERLQRLSPRSINLYVTHGIFSKGYAPLFKAGIKRIFTTDSFPQTYEVQGLKVVSL